MQFMLNQSKIFKLIFSLFMFQIIIFPPLFAEQLSKIHTVFFVHGLHGNTESFCDMPKILKRDIQAQGKNILVHAVEYQSIGNKTDGRKDFAKDVFRQIYEFMKSNHLDPRSPITLVGHSQGGVVIQNLIDMCLEKRMCGDHGEYEYLKPSSSEKGDRFPIQLKTVVTLGTPFHGSYGANRLSNEGIFGFIRSLGKEKQIEDLQVGANTEFIESEKLLKNSRLHGKEWPYTHNFKLINVAGVVQKSDLDVSISTLLGLHRVEGDLVVDAFSANPDFHYNFERPNQLASRIGDTHFSSEYLPLNNYVHVNEDDAVARLSLIKDHESQSIKCLRESADREKFIPYRVVRDSIEQDLNLSPWVSGISDGLYSQIAGELTPLHHYGVAISLEMPEDIQRIPDFRRAVVKIKEHGTSESRRIDAIQELPTSRFFDLLELERTRGSKFARLAIKDTNAFALNGFLDSRDRPERAYSHLVWYQQGRFRNNIFSHSRRRELDDGGTLDISIKIPGMKEKNIQLKVYPGRMSIAKVYLENFRPLKGREGWRVFNNGTDYLVSVFNLGEDSDLKVRDPLSPPVEPRVRAVVLNLETGSHRVEELSLDHLLERFDREAQQKVFDSIGMCYIAESGEELPIYDLKSGDYFPRNLQDVISDNGKVYSHEGWKFNGFQDILPNENKVRQKSVYHILGRASFRRIDNGEGQVGISHQEVNGALGSSRLRKGVRTDFIDRYLVTSYSLRSGEGSDPVAAPDEVDMGRGLFWVNVEDLDFLTPGETEITINGNTVPSSCGSWSQGKFMGINEGGNSR